MNNYLNRTDKIKNNKLLVFCVSVYFLSLPLGAISLSQFGSVLKYIAVVPIAAYLLSNGLRFRISWISFWQLMYTLLAFASVIYSIETSMTWQRVQTNVMFSILLVCMGSAMFTQPDLKKLKKALVWSSRITCILIMMFGIRFGGRLFLRGIIMEDPNYLNGYLLFGFVNALQIIIGKEKVKNKLFSVVELFIYIYIVLSTGSRGGLLCIIGGGSMVFLFEKVKVKQSRQIIQKFVLLIIIIFIVSVILDYVPENVMARFHFDSIIASRGTGRFDLWENAFNIFRGTSIGRKLLGFGAGTIGYIFSFYGFRYAALHNIFFEQLIEGGIVTFIVYCFLITASFKKTIRNRDTFALAVLVGFVVLSLSTSLYAFKPYWNAIIFCNFLRSDHVDEAIVHHSGS